MKKNETVSVRLPLDLMETIDSIAREEKRTRPAQICLFLETSVKDYDRLHGIKNRE